jgi:hypothetical protein
LKTDARNLINCAESPAIEISGGPMTIVSCFLSTVDHPIDENHLLWNRPLPDNRMAGAQAGRSGDSEAITYGSYFSAVSQFCAADGWGRLLNAAACKLEQPVAVKDLGPLSIFLEKHGAFYHPARLRVMVGDKPLSLVVNVAASNPGRRALPREVKALEGLNDQRPFDWFPQVYGCTTADLPMFLADWFDGFHEYHLSRRPENNKPAIVVWDGAADPCLLSEKQAADLYRSAAMILTACYDPISSRQIFPWHHAAGDFVVRVERERVGVKMITVRDYVPISQPTPGADDETALLDALVVFFIHLTVRMRLDRLDGVAEVVWAPDGCLVPTIDGFFQGLDLTARMSGLPEAFPEAVGHYLNRYDTADLLALARRITTTVFDARSEERRVIERNLNRHICRICRVLSAR